MARSFTSCHPVSAVGRGARGGCYTRGRSVVDRVIATTPLAPTVLDVLLFCLLQGAPKGYRATPASHLCLTAERSGRELEPSPAVVLASGISTSASSGFGAVHTSRILINHQTRMP